MGARNNSEDVGKGLRAEVLTPDEVAKLLRVSKRTVERLCQSGKLRAIRVGRLWRIPRSSLEEFLRGPQEQKEGENREE